MVRTLQVLFVCDGASSRSLMAAGILNAVPDSNVEAYSAGLEEEMPSPQAIEAMAECGIALPSQAIQQINDFEQQQFDYVVTLCDEAKARCLAFPRDGHNLHWTCPTPSSLADYRTTRDQLQKQIHRWVESVLQGQG